MLKTEAQFTRDERAILVELLRDAFPSNSGGGSRTNRFRLIRDRRTKHFPLFFRAWTTFSPTELAQLLNVPTRIVVSVASWYRSNGFKLKKHRGGARANMGRQGRLWEVREQFIKLWNEGCDYDQIKKALNLPFTLGAMRNFAWELRSAGYPLLKRMGGTGHEIVVNPDKKLNELESTIYDLLKRKPYSMGELSVAVDRSKVTIEEAIQSLYKKGFEVKYTQDSKQVTLEREATKTFSPLDLTKFGKNHLKFGIISDQHLGSKYQQLTLLHTAYRDFEKEKVDFVASCGDTADGMKMYPGQQYEQFLHGADEQADYTIEHWPKTDAFRTYMITGNHDHSFKISAGHNTLRYICEKRKDLVYRGELQGTFSFKGKGNFYLLHPGAGTSYAKSYKAQRISESIIMSAAEKAHELQETLHVPQFLFMGHWHYYCNFDQGPMMVMTLPCLQAQTPFLKRLGLSPTIGHVIVDVILDDRGNIIKFTPNLIKLSAHVKENDY